MATSPQINPNIFFNDELFAAEFLKILNKDKKLQPLTYKAAQRDFIATWVEKSLCLKARQQGISTAIQGKLFREAVTGTATTMTLCHDDDTTQKMRRMADRFYDNMPKYFKPTRGYNNNRTTTYTDFDSEVLIATAGNTQTGRGGTYSFIHGSEVAFWPDAESLITGAMQGGHPRVALESTPNGAQGYFYMLCMDALEGNNDWKLHFYPWWWDPDYQIPLDSDEVVIFTEDEMKLVLEHKLTPEQIKWRRAKQRELRGKFLQEYPEDPYTCFLMSGNGYFGNLDEVKAFSDQVEFTYDSSHSYYAGMDFGQANDYTDVVIYDATLNRQVDYVHVNKMPWATMRERARQKCQQWGVKLILCEANSMGTTNFEAMISEFEEHKVNTEIALFDTTNISKNRVMGNLHEALHEPRRGLKLLGFPWVKHQFNAFTARQTRTGKWALEAQEGAKDDYIIASALALEAFLGGLREIEFGTAPDILTDFDEVGA